MARNYVNWGTQADVLRSIENRPFMKARRLPDDEVRWVEVNSEGEELPPRCDVCHRRKVLRWELNLHGWEYDGKMTWGSRQWLKKGFKDGLGALMHVWMDAGDEGHREVWETCWKCKARVGRMRWGLHYKYFLARRLRRLLEASYGLEHVGAAAAVDAMVRDEAFLEREWRSYQGVARRVGLPVTRDNEPDVADQERGHNQQQQQQQPFQQRRQQRWRRRRRRR
jgi:hypothetical protein